MMGKRFYISWIYLVSGVILLMFSLCFLEFTYKFQNNNTISEAKIIDINTSVDNYPEITCRIITVDDEFTRTLITENSNKFSLNQVIKVEYTKGTDKYCKEYIQAYNNHINLYRFTYTTGIFLSLVCFYTFIGSLVIKKYKNIYALWRKLGRAYIDKKHPLRKIIL